MWIITLRADKAIYSRTVLGAVNIFPPSLTVTHSLVLKGRLYIVIHLSYLMNVQILILDSVGLAT